MVRVTAVPVIKSGLTPEASLVGTFDSYGSGMTSVLTLAPVAFSVSARFVSEAASIRACEMRAKATTAVIATATRAEAATTCVRCFRAHRPARRVQGSG